jgi:hypothetical protein
MMGARQLLARDVAARIHRPDEESDQSRIEPEAFGL